MAVAKPPTQAYTKKTITPMNANRYNEAIESPQSRLLLDVQPHTIRHVRIMQTIAIIAKGTNQK